MRLAFEYPSYLPPPRPGARGSASRPRRANLRDARGLVLASCARCHQADSLRGDRNGVPQSNGRDTCATDPHFGPIGRRCAATAARKARASACAAHRAGEDRWRSAPPPRRGPPAPRVLRIVHKLIERLAPARPRRSHRRRAIGPRSGDEEPAGELATVPRPRWVDRRRARAIPRRHAGDAADSTGRSSAKQRLTRSSATATSRSMRAATRPGPERRPVDLRYGVAASRMSCSSDNRVHPASVACWHRCRS